MKRSEINAWTTALRSGDYKQGTAFLRTCKIGSEEADFCCLGVLCDIDPEVTQNIGGYTYKGFHECSQLPRTFVQDKEFGSPTGGFKLSTKEDKQRLLDMCDALENVDPYFKEKLTKDIRSDRLSFSSLSGLNDDGVPFTTVADVIEAFDKEIFTHIEEDVK